MIFRQVVVKAAWPSRETERLYFFKKSEKKVVFGICIFANL